MYIFLLCFWFALDSQARVFESFFLLFLTYFYSPRGVKANWSFFSLFLFVVPSIIMLDSLVLNALYSSMNVNQSMNRP